VQTHARATCQAIDLAQERIASDLRDAGLTVERGTIPGRPALALALDAEWFRPDLLVVGSRPLGRFSAALLGSVSRAIVDTSPCSVLVARGPTVSRIVLVVDGSPSCASAADLVATWPLFADVRIRVVGVVASPRSDAATLAVTPRTALRGAQRAPSRLDAVVDSTIEALTRRGRDVDREIRVGDPGNEIVAAARSWNADLVVLGAEAESLLHRRLFGGVVRKVLDGVGSSVLVARPRGDDTVDGSLPTSG